MGLQFRKRTKGKTSWWNLSGTRASSSIKLGKTTFNIGTDGKIRTTINLGNGVRYVKYNSVNKKSSKKSKSQHQYSNNYSSIPPSSSVDINTSQPDHFFDTEAVSILTIIFLIPIVSFVLAYFGMAIWWAFLIAWGVQLAVVTWLQRGEDFWLWLIIPPLILLSPIGWIYIFLLWLVST